MKMFPSKPRITSNIVHLNQECIRMSSKTANVPEKKSTLHVCQHNKDITLRNGGYQNYQISIILDFVPCKSEACRRKRTNFPLIQQKLPFYIFIEIPQRTINVKKDELNIMNIYKILS